jgi:cold shock CspA family protein/ribosome-associated translation inhibitor RaiA
MTITPQVTFRNMRTAPELEAAVRKEAGALERFFNRIISCRVVIEGPRRQEPGGLYKVRIELGVPGESLVVDRNPAPHAGLREIEAARFAIHEAFRELRRRLQDYARRIRGNTKQHAEQPAGTVTRLAPEGDFGFLEADGREVYFHRNSVLGGHFDRLRIGSQVRFAEERGEHGPQAGSVRLVRPARQGRNAAAHVLLPTPHREDASL